MNGFQIEKLQGLRRLFGSLFFFNEPSPTPSRVYWGLGGTELQLYSTLEEAIEPNKFFCVQREILS